MKKPIRLSDLTNEEREALWLRSWKYPEEHKTILIYEDDIKRAMEDLNNDQTGKDSQELRKIR